jgi:ACS family hexuronate transporter-like MFS transporter
LERWRIAIVVSVAIAISYLDRQTLPVGVKAISQQVPLSNEQFSTLQSAFLFACALMYAGGGKLVDVLGTRRVSLVIMLFWPAACASHAFAIGFLSLAAARFLLNERIYRKCRREARLQLVDRRTHLRHVSRRARNTVCCPVQPC